jgi:thiamine-phosphate pyrophosphorylase
VNRYAITDSLEVVRRAADMGANLIQIRAKELSARTLMRLVEHAVGIAPGRIVVNTRADIAMACGAAGVHLPSDSPSPRRIVPPEFLIGASCHNIAELQWAESEEFNFVVYGPIFDTPGKGPALGLDALRQAVNSVRVPIYALGGVTEENARLCLEAGAYGIAGMRLFSTAPRSSE